MRALKDILNLKKIGKASFLDEKTVEGIFFNVLNKELQNIEHSDIKEFKIKERKIILKTIHPAVASEIWRRREDIIAQINEKSGFEIIDSLSVK